ncbi:MAG: MFS transporter [Pseudomonadota bacterium]|jgi:GPH family glycoside/pentoside/hexuronide:cation symporter|nr:MFS transporter [Pseudomonadota bacterium]
MCVPPITGRMRPREGAPPVRLSYPRLLGYALGAFGTGVFATVPTVLLLYFCTESLKMAPVLAATVVLLPKLWALVWDPAVGLWSDRAQTAIGRRRPFLLAGSIGVPLTFFALFAWPYPQGNAAFVGVALLYFLLTNAYSLFAVPFISIPAEISEDAAERERVGAWRIGCAMIGTLIGAGLAPMLVRAGGSGRDGYVFMAIWVSLICCAGMFAAFFATPSATGTRTAQALSLRQAISILLAERPFRRLAAAYVLQLTGVGIVSALTPYWIIQVAGRTEDSVGTALGIMLSVTILSTPVWAWVVRHMGARWVISVAALFFGVATLGFLAVPPAPVLPSLLLYALIGFPFAGLQVGPFALVAHLTHAAGEARGNRAGLFTGVWTASEKLGLALGPGVAGLGLAVVGFQAGAPVQSQEALWGLAVLLAAAPSLFVWASLPFVRK